MSLKNYQYQLILKEYDKRRLKSHRDLERRKQEVYAALPELEAIDKQIIEGSIKSAKASLFGDPTELKTLAERNRILSEQKLSCLVKHGYPIDYLQPRYFCPDCKDTGYIENEKCHCFQQAIVNLIYTQSNVKQAIQKENFETFSFQYYSNDYVDEKTGLTPLANIDKILETIQDFIRSFDKEHENLLIYGNTGVGKTFLSNCIAKELLDAGHTVIYLTAFQLFHILEKYKFSKEEEMQAQYQNQFDYILDCDLLIIDDLGTEMNNTFTSSQFYLCINERQLRQKSTIISTNLSLDQIHSNYSERVSSRLTSNYTLLQITGDDIRIKKKLM